MRIACRPARGSVVWLPATAFAARRNQPGANVADFNPNDFLYFPLPVAVARMAVSPGAKLAYAYLVRCAGVDGQAYPSLRTIAGAVGVTRRQAKRYVDELGEVGLARQHVGRGKRRSDGGVTALYELLPHAVFEAADRKSAPAAADSTILTASREQGSPEPKRDAGDIADLVAVLKPRFPTIRAAGGTKWGRLASDSGVPVSELAEWIRTNEGKAFTGADTPMLPVQRAIEGVRGIKSRPYMGDWRAVADALAAVCPEGFRDRVRLPNEAQQHWHSSAEQFPGGLQRLAGALRTGEARRYVQQAGGQFTCSGLIDSLAHVDVDAAKEEKRRAS